MYQTSVVLVKLAKSCWRRCLKSSFSLHALLKRSEYSLFSFENFLQVYIEYYLTKNHFATRLFKYTIISSNFCWQYNVCVEFLPILKTLTLRLNFAAGCWANYFDGDKVPTIPLQRPVASSFDCFSEKQVDHIIYIRSNLN